MPKVSELMTLPKQVPIDWFDPIYWNIHLTVRERAHYVWDGAYIALPNAELCASWMECAKWKNLSTKEFMEKYGNAVLAEYNLPTEEEIEQLEEWDENEVAQDLEGSAEAEE
jgi:hypothetical protein